MEPATSEATQGDRQSVGASQSSPASTCKTQNGGLTSPSVAPPYWKHNRSASYASRTSLDSTNKPPPITLEDHTESPSERSSALWAKSVSIDDYVLVNGNRTGLGAYVVWNCKVQTLDGGPMIIRKRYSEFDQLRANLLATFPSSKNSMPALPPKSIVHKFRANFLEKRRSGLAYFMNCVLLNPEFAGSPVLKDFLFSHTNN